MKKILHWHQNLKLGYKIMSSYILLMLIPAVVFIVFSYRSNIATNRENQLNYEQNLLQQEALNLEIQLKQYESIPRFFQQNQSVLNFLYGNYYTASEEIYYYIRDISTIFTYLRNVSDTADLTIYRYSEAKTNLAHDILPISAFPGDIENTRKMVRMADQQGAWSYDRESGLFVCYSELYSESSHNALGLLEVKVRPNELLGNFEASRSLFLLDGEYFCLVNGKLESGLQQSTYPDTIQLRYLEDPLAKNILSSSIHLKWMNMDVITLSEFRSTALGSSNYVYQIYFWIIMLILSVVNYAIVYQILSRLRKLTMHIRQSESDNLHIFERQGPHDEVGVLIDYYNRQIVEIHELIDKVYRTELMKKEADYYALIAQIRPHFIYNALETIRMMAETADAPQVADTTYHLGRYIRYNLSQKINDTTLALEVENVNNYMYMYTASMRGRLSYRFEISIDIANIICPGFILQPLFENAIHHGITDQRNTLDIEARIERTNGLIDIRVTDNGQGIEPDKLAELNKKLNDENLPPLNDTNDHVGLLNVSRRIRAFFMPLQCSLTLDSVYGEWTTCTIQFKEKTTWEEELS